MSLRPIRPLHSSWALPPHSRSPRHPSMATVPLKAAADDSAHPDNCRTVEFGGCHDDHGSPGVANQFRPEGLLTPRVAQVN